METELALPLHRYPTQRRRWTRYEIDVPVRVITLRLGKVTLVEGRGSNVNCGGMAVSVGIDLCTCEHVTLELTLPGSARTIRLRSAVRHRRGHTYGMEFIVRSDVDRQNVRQVEAILERLGSLMQ